MSEVRICKHNRQYGHCGECWPTEIPNSPDNREKPTRVELRPAQKSNLETLRKNFGLSDAELNRCLFFRGDQDEPWIPPDILEAIARTDGGFQQIASVHDKYVSQREQVFYIATVVDGQGRTFTRSGAALLGEKPNGIEIDTEVLANGRALSAALTAAGFNPFKAGSVVDMETPRFTGRLLLSDRERELHKIADAAELRTKDLKQIHAIADKKGLISKTGDMSKYRAWLQANFGVISAGQLEAEGRSAVINMLTSYEAGGEWLLELPVEIREDALIA